VRRRVVGRGGRGWRGAVGRAVQLSVVASTAEGLGGGWGTIVERRGGGGGGGGGGGEPCVVGSSPAAAMIPPEFDEQIEGWGESSVFACMCVNEL